MRILILSCNTGEGHNSAARALAEVFESANIYCETADSLAFLSQKASNFISKWHVRLYKKMPLLFGIGYKAAEFTDRYERSMIYEIVSKGARKLNKKIKEGKYDTIICTHPFAAMTLTKAIKKYKLDVKSFFVATDYTCSPGVSSSKLDYYIIPHESLAEDFEKHGLPKEKLFAGGIPVSKKMHTEKEPSQSKRELSIDENKRVVLLMCGSMGCGPIKLIAKKVASLIRDDEYFVVICGNNRKLYKSLKKIEKENAVRVLGFTKNIPDYMNAAELILTKPGGLSTTEAAENHLPMVLIDAVSGCETYNMRFWVNNEMAKTSEKTSELCELVRKLLDDENELQKMRENLKESFSVSSSQKIFDFIMELQ